MKTLTGKVWLEALNSATSALANNVERINALNVFPVPDGDTGSNMFATLENAQNELRNVSDGPLGEISARFSRGTLMGARGNSGVILSQIFKGFALAFKDKDTGNGYDLAQAFDKAREQAYKSVLQPVEGTILTVIRLTAEQLLKTVTPSHEIEKVFELARAFARKACDDTPNLLPVLKETNVVDSGGEGLCVILDAIHLALIGQPTTVQKDRQAFSNSFIMEGEVFNGEYGYCTEFIMRLQAPHEFNRDRFAKSLSKYGTSLVVVHDEEILKVHIHTERPGNFLTYAQKYGDFVRIKSENMTIQANESNALKAPGPRLNASTAITAERKVMVISCNVGQGIIKEMRELGTDFIIESGQSINPSAKDFMKAIEALPAKQIILLPNNPNVLLVAQQVAQTARKQIVVIPTKSQLQGLAAMMVFDEQSSLLANQKAMERAMSSTFTGQVTIASRTTKIDNVQVQAGEVLAIAERKILGSFKKKLRAAIAVVNELISDEVEHVVIYYGEDATEADAVELASYIENKYDVDIEIKNGGQPLYYFLLSFNKELPWE